MKILNFIPLFAIVFTSCVNDNAFDKSERNTPLEIRVQGQLNSRIVLGNGTSQHPDTAFVQMNDQANLTDITIEYIMVPSLARISPSPIEVHDFTKPVLFTITSESGSYTRELWVVISYGNFNLQLQYNKLETWYQMGSFKNGDGYFGIGEVGASTPWANTNVATQILNKAGLQPSNYPQPTGNAMLGTLMNPTGGKSVGAGIASGTLFTGMFRSNPNFFLDRDKQQDNVDFGVAYRHRPRSLTFEYKYTPGTQVERWVACSTCGAAKWQGIDINTVDSMEMWLILQNRVYNEVNPASTKFTRVAAAGFISSTNVEQWQKVTVPISYGKPTDAFLRANPESYRIASVNAPWTPRFVYQYQPKQNSNDPTSWSFTPFRIKEQWSTNPDNETITHLTITFNSSANGWNYEGAGTDANRGRIGSKLEVRNVVFQE